MKNLLAEETYIELTTRLQKLQPDSKALWGKMKVAQMLAHVSEAYEVPLSENAIPRMFIGRLIGWAFKPMMYNDKPWKQNLPTAPSFIITEEKDFNKELLNQLNKVELFHTSTPENIGRHPHPMFGTFTTEQWGKAMYKHLNHHLEQFGV
jgi:Protein of unknown function (DUF1569)